MTRVFSGEELKSTEELKNTAYCIDNDTSNVTKTMVFMSSLEIRL